MIDDDIAAVLDRERVIAAPFVAIFVDADADVANDDVARSLHHHRRKATGAAIMGKADAAARRRLPGNREIGVADDGRFSDETADAAYSENVRQKPARIEGGVKRTRAAVIKCRDLDDCAAR